MKKEPCFECTLPDCIDTSPHCLLRIMTRRVANKRKKKQHDQITEIERAGENMRYLVWEMERKAQLSEIAA